MNPTGDGGSDSPVMANGPQRTAWNSNPDKNPDFIQLENLRVASRLWVELPDCAGGADDIPLSDDISNATIATCKTRPAPKD